MLTPEERLETGKEYLNLLLDAANKNQFLVNDETGEHLQVWDLIDILEDFVTDLEWSL